MAHARAEDLTEAVSALPSAVNPLALSLNENPFPPLPASAVGADRVRSTWRTGIRSSCPSGCAR